MKKLKQAVQDTQDTVDDMLEMTGDCNGFLRMQLRGIRMNTALTLHLLNAAEGATTRVVSVKNAAISALRKKLQHTK